MSFRKIYKYFFPRGRLPRLPSHYISKYGASEGTREERLIMASGHARSPEQARRLMRHYNVSRAAELLNILGPRKYEVTAWSRFVSMVRRAQGAARYNPYRIPKQVSRLPVKVQIKNK